MKVWGLVKGLVCAILSVLLVHLTQEAQVGTFKNTPTIKVETLSTPICRFDKSVKTNRPVIIYKGEILSIPFSSIAYWEKL